MQHEASEKPLPTVPGRLIYLVGPSGVGKDSLIEAAAPWLAQRGIQRVRRVITRSAESKGEQAIGVTLEAFEQMVRQGTFAMHWRANGLGYGIAKEVDDWLASGSSVLVNGSREYQAQALRRYPDMLLVWLYVQPQVLRQRLRERGRESDLQIEARLARNESLEPARDAAVHLLDNSGSLQDTVNAFIALLERNGITGARG